MTCCRRIAQNILALFLSAHFFAASSIAEVITVSGLQFEVEEFTIIDERTVKVRVLTEEKIAERSAAEAFVVEKHFSDPAAAERYGVKDLEKFLDSALAAGDAELAVIGIKFLIQRSLSSDEEKLSLLKSLAASDESQFAFRHALLALQDGLLSGVSSELPAGVSFMLFNIALADAEWVRVYSARLLYRFGEGLRAFIRQTFIEAAAQGNESTADSAVMVAGSLFGKDDEFFKDIHLIHEQGRRIKQAMSQGDLEVLYSIAEATGENELRGAVLTPAIVRALHALAEKALAEKKFESAVATLTRVPRERRNDKTHELLRMALKGVKPGPRSILSSSAVSEFLLFMSEHDQEIKGDLIMLLIGQIRFLSSTTAVENSENYFAMLLKLRPDPHPGNDELRIDQAVGYLNRGEFTRASWKQAEVRSKLTMLARVRLFAAQLTHERDGILMFGYWIVLIVAIPYLFKVAHAIARDPWIFKGKAAKEEDIRGGFNFTLFGKGLNPRTFEYQRCLRLLGLEGAVDVKTIKAAYRSAVKDVHPDINPTNDPQASDRFISLTTAYERALELRKEMGLPD